MISISKPAYNEEYRDFEFKRPDGKGQLSATETLTAATAICSNVATGEDATAEMIDFVSVHESTAVAYLLKGGVIGTTYKIEFRVSTSNGQKLSDYLLVEVI